MKYNLNEGLNLFIVCSFLILSREDPSKINEMVLTQSIRKKTHKSYGKRKKKYFRMGVNEQTREGEQTLKESWSISHK